MSYSGRFVTARPPSRRQVPPQLASTGAEPARSNEKPVQDAVAPLAPSVALAVFHTLLADWSIAPAPAWRMLTGLGYQAGSLTDDQVMRVAHLIAIDTAMKRIGGQPVGAWMTTGNMAPVLSGSSPIAYLTRGGLTAYATLLRQVERWAAM